MSKNSLNLSNLIKCYQKSKHKNKRIGSQNISIVSTESCITKNIINFKAIVKNYILTIIFKLKTNKLPKYLLFGRFSAFLKEIKTIFIRKCTSFHYLERE